MMNGESIYGDPFETALLTATEQGRARSAALRKTPLISTPTHGVESPQPQPGADPRAAPDYRGKALELMQQASDLGEPREEDTRKLADYARQRHEGSNRDLLLGIALSSMGGESFAPAGGHILRRALAAAEPMKLGHGVIEGGQFVADPEAGAQRRALRLENQARLYEAMAQHAETIEQDRK